MIPAKFDYRRPQSLDEAIALLGQYGDEAKILAGGHSLLPLMKLRLSTPEVLIDIGRIPGLSYVEDRGDHIAIGASTRYRELQINELLQAQAPIVAHTAGEVGDPQVRHRGTIGGSCAHGDPASDLPAVVLALDGTMVIQGPSGRRTVPASEFYLGFLETAVNPDEVLVELQVKKTSGGWSFQKFHRRAIDWAIVGVAVAQVDGSFHIGLINMGPTPLRATAVERALAAGEAFDNAAQLAAEGTEPTADNNASVEYRQHLARVLVRRGLEEALR